MSCCRNSRGLLGILLRKMEKNLEVWLPVKSLECYKHWEARNAE